MATKKTPGTIKVPLIASTFPRYQQGLTVFQAGAEVFEQFRLGTDVELEFDDGVKVKASLRGKFIGPLIDMISSYGGQSIYTIDQPYSPSMLVQILTEANDGNPVDVTRLYTVLMVVPELPPVPEPVPA